MRLETESEPVGFTAETTPVLDIRGLAQDFELPDRLVHAVVDVNLTAHGGQVTALVGESGSGKSVTSLTVMGIEDKNARIRRGEIYLSGVETLYMKKKERRFYVSRHAGMIFQEPMDSLNPLLTVGYQLTEAARVHENLTQKQARALAMEQLKAVSLPQPEELMKQYPFMLSGGMCQRVMIAIAAISRPPLLIADEPTTALDVTVQEQILRQLDELRRREKMAVLLITHDLGVVAELADQVYIMQKGRIVEQGNVYDIFDHPLHPYTKQLLDAAL